MADIVFSAQEYANVAASMLQSMRGQLVQALIVDRIMARKKLANKMTLGETNADGQNRQNISQLRYSIASLEELSVEYTKAAEKEVE